MSLRIFISSVQKELELERAAVAALIGTDPFLLQHCVPVLFEKEPPPPRPAKQPYLDALGGCAVYVLIRSAGQALHARGLAVRGPKPDEFQATAAAYLLFGPQPANRFPQCELLADAYDDVRLTGQPKGQAGIDAPLPHALEQALKFVDVHTFHPRRVVGLNNVRLDEYPTAALREALVNAVAHRSYDDRSRKIFVRIFRDRIEVASPGYAPKPLTLAKLRRGGYRPCSRNPLIAQTLATLAVMEQRGSGFARMRDAKELTELGILSLQGKGRAVRYVLRDTTSESTDNRPT